MAKAEKPQQLSLRDLQETLLAAALDRVAHVLRPFPADAAPEELTAALEAMRRKGYVQGSARTPNLTAAGVEAARKLAKRD